MRMSAQTEFLLKKPLKIETEIAVPIPWHKNGASMPMTCKRKSDTIVLSTSGFFF